jgi:hypothetical protein
VYVPAQLLALVITHLRCCHVSQAPPADLVRATLQVLAINVLIDVGGKNQWWLLAWEENSWAILLGFHSHMYSPLKAAIEQAHALYVLFAWVLHSPYNVQSINAGHFVAYLLRC